MGLVFDTVFNIFKLAFLFVALMFLTSCGGGGGGGGISTVVIPPSPFGLSVRVLDGPIEGARVRLFSLSKGYVAGNMTTDDEGRASFSVGRTFLNSIADSDHLFYYADNPSIATLQRRDGSFVQIPAGQLALRSSLPQVSHIRQELLKGKEIGAQDGTKKAGVITHFTHARTVLIEGLLRMESLLDKTFFPDQVQLSAQAIDRWNHWHGSLDASMYTSESQWLQKYKLLAATTKSIYESGLVKIYEDRPLPAHPLDALVSLVNQEGSTLTNNFADRLVDYDFIINTDLKDSDFTGSIEEQVSLSQTVSVTSIQLTLVATQNLTDIPIVPKGFSSAVNAKKPPVLLDQKAGGANFPYLITFTSQNPMATLTQPLNNLGASP